MRCNVFAVLLAASAAHALKATPRMMMLMKHAQQAQAPGPLGGAPQGDAMDQLAAGPLGGVPRGGAIEVKSTKAPSAAWLRPCAAELFGTFMIVLCGCGITAGATVTGSLVGGWQAASVWAWTVALAVYTTMHISGAHLNPALTVAFKLLRPSSISWAGAARYIASQLLGACLGAKLVLMAWGGHLAVMEKKWAIVRGLAGSERSSSVLTLHFPPPGAFKPAADFASLLGPWQAVALEALGTALLSFVVFSMTHPKNKTLGENKSLLPIVVGFTVAIASLLVGPLTGGGFNPARDLGARLISFFSGWGPVAFPGTAGAFWVYTLGPIIGGLVGGLIAEKLNEEDA